MPDPTSPILCLPGWATDERLFSGLPIPAVPVHGPVPDASALTGPVTLLGWSLGGFRALAFARAYPHLVRRLVLVGIRRQYPAAAIAAMRQALQHAPARCLTEFYRQCFLPAQRADYRRFRVEIEPAYLREIAVEALLADLDELGGYCLTPEAWPACPTILVHGAQDVIAPLDEAQALAAAAGLPLHVLPAAHAAFLVPEFREVLNHDRL